MDLAREGMKKVEAKKGNEVDRDKWKIFSRCGDPEWGEALKRRIKSLVIQVVFIFLFCTVYMLHWQHLSFF